MEKELLNIISNLKSSGLSLNGKKGIEKESLRMDGDKLSKKPHSRALGSALCNNYITNDFSEAQLELITQPKGEISLLKESLRFIHHFVIQNIDDESLWPLSMPPSIKDVNDIPIAYFGESNLGKFKHIYRKGLSNRYGRLMQAISGIHFNYSLPEIFIEGNLINTESLSIIDKKSTIYFSGLRNLYRMNWLVLFLFGASPVIPEEFLSKKYKFKKLSEETYYLPYATSLRMSDLGYQNHNQSDIQISLNNLKEYTDELFMYISSYSESFSKFDINGKRKNQLNTNILQVEDEFYAPARPKSMNSSSLRSTLKLENTGVDYLELRSIDLNPFSRDGIDESELYLLEVLLLYCLIKDSPKILKTEQSIIQKNNHLVSIEGRRENIKLMSSEGDLIGLKDWALEILDDLMLIAELLDNDGNSYSASINSARKKILSNEETLAQKVIDSIHNEKSTVGEFGTFLGNKYKNYYSNIHPAQNDEWNILEKEASNSIDKQKILESESEISWNDYVDNYYK
tara:strand:+ start:2406 stop:3947 length:1542 start_codon:yes stop_codon:yes gene_type:complete